MDLAPIGFGRGRRAGRDDRTGGGSLMTRPRTFSPKPMLSRTVMCLKAA
jgi:hypothetical protein